MKGVNPDFYWRSRFPWWAIATAISSLLALRINWMNQLVEPSMFLAVYRPIGLGLLKTHAYGCTYPLWGYPLAVAAIGTVSQSLVNPVLPIVQVFLAWLVGVSFLKPLLRTRPVSVYIAVSALFAPVFMCAAFRLPDAVVMIWIMTTALSLRQWMSGEGRSWLWLAAVATVVGVTMRSEVLIFSCFSLFVFASAVWLRRSYATYRRMAVFAAAMAAGAVVGVLPWAGYTWHSTGSPLLTSTNGAHVMYIGLGA